SAPARSARAGIARSCSCGCPEHGAPLASRSILLGGTAYRVALGTDLPRPPVAAPAFRQSGRSSGQVAPFRALLRTGIFRLDTVAIPHLSYQEPCFAKCFIKKSTMSRCCCPGG